MKLKLVAGSIFLVTAFSASAADQAFNIVPNLTFDFNGMALPGNGLLSGGSDVLTFTGIPAGTYDAVLSYSANYVNITSAWLNGNAPDAMLSGVNTSLGSFDVIGNSPFTLTLNGTAGTSPLAAYSGHITITPVPEPASYAMLLLGIGLLAFTARRKSQGDKFY
jgi:hypothetical protein